MDTINPVHSLVHIGNMKAVHHIESIINIGHMKAHNKRFPNRNKYLDMDKIGVDIHWHCTELDKMGIPWSTQNNALQFVNNGYENDVWACLYKHSFLHIAQCLLEGTTFNEMVKGD